MSSENGDTQNETPSESEKMDISEVSDQVSPVSDQSPIETVDNAASKDSKTERLESLDNASAAVSATTTNTNTTTPSTANLTRERLDSALSLEGFDLELPTLDTYQEEYVDFPSSPKQLKECLEAHGLTMPLERDSGTTGRSEEEDDEDTSIYQAVLSPDCQDVRLKKDNSEEITRESVLTETNLPVEYSEDLENNKNAADLIDENENNRIEVDKSEEKKNRLRRVLTPNPEDALLPNIYGNRAAIELLPDALPETPNKLMKAVSSHDIKIYGSLQKNSGLRKSSKTQSNLDLSMSGDTNGDIIEDDSSFIFERRDSKRLAKKYFGGRIVEGFFVESPSLKDNSNVSNSGLRRIALSQSLQTMDSPTGDDSPSADDNSPTLSVLQDKHKSLSNFEERLNIANSSMSPVTERELTTDMKNKVITSVEIHSEMSETCSQREHHKPVPKTRTKPLTRSYSSPIHEENKSMRSPPCPKPRRKLQNLSDSCKKKDVDLDRRPVLLLDPMALQHQVPTRGAPNINPDGSVEIRQGWSLMKLIRPWW